MCVRALARSGVAFTRQAAGEPVPPRLKTSGSVRAGPKKQRNKLLSGRRKIITMIVSQRMTTLPEMTDMSAAVTLRASVSPEAHNGVSSGEFLERMMVIVHLGVDHYYDHWPPRDAWPG